MRASPSSLRRSRSCTPVRMGYLNASNKPNTIKIVKNRGINFRQFAATFGPMNKTFLFSSKYPKKPDSSTPKLITIVKYTNATYGPTTALNFNPTLPHPPQKYDIIPIKLLLTCTTPKIKQNVAAANAGSENFETNNDP
mmetsp:Transcript_37232/g.80349  ORF Transcript_37232/g.80349 Transcript_37232/m.80349 type:complete len:139 (-) Transcript_37232:440-856(-)